MIELTSSLRFAGDCEAAFKVYARCFGGEIAFLLRWCESPMAADAPAGWGDKILYARLTVGRGELLGADLPPDQYQRPQGFGVMLGLDDVAEAERLFNALAQDGVVTMPLQETFWAARYGNLVDRFGIPWEINCGRPH